MNGLFFFVTNVQEIGRWYQNGFAYFNYFPYFKQWPKVAILYW